ncbi:MAG: hypothetical protein B6U85_07310 [Desulfurococcales archaeon ex4484_42]|nr:MAG: hypothetical protein B6U85_07310 [Desulfurococcales archaeon ex4484_42]
MKFPKRGVNELSILSELRSKYCLDAKHDLGEVLGSMTTKPLDVAIRAFEIFWRSNLNDPYTFPGSSIIEREVIEALADLYECNDCSGLITTGGSESNLTALYIIRELGFSTVGVPKSAHFSVFKACKLLKLNIYELDLDKDFRVSIGSVKEALDKGVRAFIFTAGTTELGLIDPIDKLGRVINEYSGLIHVDAAYAGFVIPFLKELGLKVPKVSFSNPAVRSLCVDGHKMGLTPIPNSALILRPPELIKYVEFPARYMPLNIQRGLLGTRTAGSAAALYAVIKYLGIEGFTEVVKYVMGLLKYLIKRLREEDFSVPVEPDVPIVCIEVKDPDKYLKELAKRRLFVYKCSLIKGVRVVIMPHLSRYDLDRFIEALKNVRREVG